MLVTLDEHYEIHRAQGDYAACYLMAVQRMNKTPEEISENSRLAALKRIEEGTSPFQNPEFLKRKSIETRQRNLELSALGLNPWQNSELIERNRLTTIKRNAELVAKGEHQFQTAEFRAIANKVNQERLETGTHNFQDKEAARQNALRRVEEGTHHFVGGQVQRNLAARLLNDGTHHLQTSNPNTVRVSCLVCRKETTMPCLKRDHKHKDT
jgi:hypothetical protein